MIVGEIVCPHCQSTNFRPKEGIPTCDCGYILSDEDIAKILNDIKENREKNLICIAIDCIRGSALSSEKKADVIDGLKGLDAYLKIALEQMINADNPCEFCMHNDSGEPNDGQDPDEKTPCIDCHENGGDSDEWEWKAMGD